MGIRERSPETWSQQKGDDEDERAVSFSSCFLVLVFFFSSFGYVWCIYRPLYKLYIPYSSHRSSVASILFFRSCVRVFAKFWNLSRYSSDKEIRQLIHTSTLMIPYRQGQLFIWYIPKNKKNSDIRVSSGTLRASECYRAHPTESLFIFFLFVFFHFFLS